MRAENASERGVLKLRCVLRSLREFWNGCGRSLTLADCNVGWMYELDTAGISTVSAKGDEIDDLNAASSLPHSSATSQPFECQPHSASSAFVGHCRDGYRCVTPPHKPASIHFCPLVVIADCPAVHVVNRRGHHRSAPVSDVIRACFSVSAWISCRSFYSLYPSPYSRRV